MLVKHQKVSKYYENDCSYEFQSAMTLYSQQAQMK